MTTLARTRVQAHLLPLRSLEHLIAGSIVDERAAPAKSHCEVPLLLEVQPARVPTEASEMI